MIRDYIVSITNIQTLHSLYKDELSYHIHIHSLSQTIKYEYQGQNKPLFKFGDFGDRYYIILKGAVEVLVPKWSQMRISRKEYYVYLAKLRIYNENGLLNEVMEKNKDKLSLTIPEIDEFIEYEIEKNQKRILEKKKAEEEKAHKKTLARLKSLRRNTITAGNKFNFKLSNFSSLINQVSTNIRKDKKFGTQKMNPQITKNDNESNNINSDSKKFQSHKNLMSIEIYDKCSSDKNLIKIEINNENKSKSQFMKLNDKPIKQDSSIFKLENNFENINNNNKNSNNLTLKQKLRNLKTIIEDEPKENYYKIQEKESSKINLNFKNIEDPQNEYFSNNNYQNEIPDLSEKNNLKKKDGDSRQDNTCSIKNKVESEKSAKIIVPILPQFNVFDVIEESKQNLETNMQKNNNFNKDSKSYVSNNSSEKNFEIFKNQNASDSKTNIINIVNSNNFLSNFNEEDFTTTIKNKDSMSLNWQDKLDVLDKLKSNITNKNDQQRNYISKNQEYIHTALNLLKQNQSLISFKGIEDDKKTRNSNSLKRELSKNSTEKEIDNTLNCYSPYKYGREDANLLNNKSSKNFGTLEDRFLLKAAHYGRYNCSKKDQEINFFDDFYIELVSSKNNQDLINGTSWQAYIDRIELISSRSLNHDQKETNKIKNGILKDNHSEQINLKANNTNYKQTYDSKKDDSFDSNNDSIDEIEEKPLLFDLNIAKYANVRTLKCGDMFGEVALKEHISKRTATIFTSKECHFGWSNKEKYDAYLSENKTKNILNEVVNLLNCPIFRNHNKITFFRDIYFTLQKRYVGRNELIFKEGEEIKNIIFLNEGEYVLKVKKNLFEINQLIKKLGGIPINEHREIEESGGIYNTFIIIK